MRKSADRGASASKKKTKESAVKTKESAVKTKARNELERSVSRRGGSGVTNWQSQCHCKLRSRNMEIQCFQYSGTSLQGTQLGGKYVFKFQ